MASSDEDDPRTGKVVTESEWAKMTPRQLAELALPPAKGVIKTALFRAFHFRSIEKAVQAYFKAIAAEERVYDALARRDTAHLAWERAARKLELAETHIHPRDEDEWTRERITAEEARKDVEHRAKLAELRRRRELQEAQDAHDKWERKRTPKPEPTDGAVDLDDLSEDEREFADHFEAKTRPVRRRKIVEAIVQKYIDEGTVRPDDKESIAELWRDAEELIKDEER